jgi:hypothetical protein
MHEKFVGDAVRFVAAHEVGHTLGLRHNFKSSAATPFEKLNDKEFVEKNGITGSVMDYPTANISYDTKKQGYYFAPNVGTYDDWAIRWGYSEVDGEDEWEQVVELNDIADECSETRHHYGTDWDTYPSHALDPRSNIWDLSDDPIKFAEERLAICDDLLQNDALDERIVPDGGRYTSLRWAVQTILMQKYAVLNLATKNIGGQYTGQAHKGDKKLPFEAIPARQQQRALDFIIDNALNVDRFMISSELLGKLADNKQSSWENNLYARGRRFDFPLANWVAGIQNGVLTNLLNPSLQARVSDAGFRVDAPFKLNDLYSSLTEAIWDGTAESSGRTAVLHRNLQRIYLGKLIRQVTNPFPGTPQDAVALSRLHLTRIRGDINQNMRRARADDATAAHLGESLARIDRALDAKRITGF